MQAQTNYIREKKLFVISLITQYLHLSSFQMMITPTVKELSMIHRLIFGHLVALFLICLQVSHLSLRKTKLNYLRISKTVHGPKMYLILIISWKMMVVISLLVARKQREPQLHYFNSSMKSLYLTQKYELILRH
jgi:hypothetical protein